MRYKLALTETFIDGQFRIKCRFFFDKFKNLLLVKERFGFDSNGNYYNRIDGSTGIIEMNCVDIIQEKLLEDW